MALAALAEHAERGGLIQDAAAGYIAAAKESSARSAVAEARHLLERSLSLLEGIPHGELRERLELSALAALGPILTSTEGNKSPDACLLYERGVEMARRRPVSEQVEWFPLYWGWWFTGADFAIQRERAEAVIADLRDVADPQIQLQARHCAWAIDFNMGRHEACIEAVDAGMLLYQAGRGRENLTLYGGHDAKVCGLGQRGLSLWFKGYPERAVDSVRESTEWAQEIGHLGSIAHAYDIAAMLHRYRRNYAALQSVAEAMERLARKHDLASLRAKALIFEGWSEGNTGDAKRGRILAEAGFAIQREIRNARRLSGLFGNACRACWSPPTTMRRHSGCLARRSRSAKEPATVTGSPNSTAAVPCSSAKLPSGDDEAAPFSNRAWRSRRSKKPRRSISVAYDTALSLGVAAPTGGPSRGGSGFGDRERRAGGEMAASVAFSRGKLGKPQVAAQ